METQEARVNFSRLVLAELARARAKFPKRQHSLAEAREVIREEFDEFVEASREGPQYAPIDPLAPGEQTRTMAAIKELVQLTAMCYRTAIEVYGFEDET